ncbi:capsule assembly Wzi family protein [Pigmentiphaga humi]|nr:capsule assembly Wzi family protein [Pigmentiphaga humi]
MSNKLLSRCLAAGVLAAAMLGILVPANAVAQAAAMVEAGNSGLRDDIQWLVDRGVIGYVSTSTWPIPVSVLEAALETRKKTGLNRADAHAILAIHRYLEDQKSTRYGITAQVNSGSLPQLGFGSQSHAAATGGAYFQGGNDSVAGKLQVSGLLDPMTSKQSKVSLDGSYVSGRFLGQAVYVGQLAHYWGPGVDGSINWGNAATSIPGIGLQRAKQTAPESPWLAWIGPWGYNIFAGQMLHDTSVPDARVFNMRVFARPFKGLELGASRFIEWGGEGRDNGWSAFWNAVTGQSNEYAAGRDPSNELSGVDVRYTLNVWDNPLTLYGQLAGEDESGRLPSHHLAQVGVQFKHLVGSTRVQWHAEAADTMARRVFGLGQGMPGTAYNHTTYKNGLYHDGMPIGHPIGGSGRMLSAGVTVVPDDFQFFSRYSFRVMQAEVNEANQATNQLFPHSARWYGAEFAYSWVMRPATFSAGVMMLRRTAGNFDNAYGVLFSMNVPLGSAR